MPSPTKSTNDTSSRTSGEAWDILCVLGVDGDPDFCITCTNNSTIAQLKKAIHQHCIDDLSHIRADKLKLYLIELTSDEEIAGTSTVPDNHILMKASRNKLAEYIGNRDRDKVYVFVEFPPPQPVAQVAVATEESKILQKTIEALQKTIETLNNSIHKKDAKLEALTQNHTFKLIVEPNRKTYVPWSTNPQTAKLDELKEVVSKKYFTDIIDSAVLKLTVKTKRDTSLLESDPDLQIILRQCVQKNELVINILVETPSKPFSSYTLKTVNTLYDLSSTSKPGLDIFPTYTCGTEPVNDEKIFSHLIEDLKQSCYANPLFHASESSHSAYVYSFLKAVVNDLKSTPESKGTRFTLRQEKEISGEYGEWPVDYAITTNHGVVVGVTEVKKKDFEKGVAQNVVQMDSVLTGSRKRKADDIDEALTRCFGIVTDAKDWMFLECTRDDSGSRPQFKYSSCF